MCAQDGVEGWELLSEHVSMCAAHQRGRLRAQCASPSLPASALHAFQAACLHSNSRGSSLDPFRLLWANYRQ